MKDINPNRRRSSTTSGQEEHKDVDVVMEKFFRKLELRDKKKKTVINPYEQPQ